MADFGKPWEIVGNETQETAPAGNTFGFMGNFTLKLDSALRVSIPAKFREVLDAKYPSVPPRVILMPFNGKIKLFPAPVWEKKQQQFMALNDLDVSADDFQSYIFGSTKECSLDGQNRIQVSPDLCEDAGITKEVVVVGRLDHMEMWDAGRWAQFKAETAKNFKAVMGDVFRNQHGGSRQAE